ncbi:dual specificity protein phosphatase family protein [Candidatus Haliotispira prima]|uniref:Dual specificity protein phosphatase family protein n=1 Tax=Candidatus Haliotispira prima TaxID=3034016 RepID=A0ABY8MK78_9SPIO|nr:dual specificity protein phosphatase family protein [Candidatus Haliotispira prima]
MQKIGNWNIYVGTKEEHQQAVSEGMKIVCALNRASGFVTHQSVVGWSGRGCNKDNPHYLFKQTNNAIYLNMIDGDNPAYVNDDMVNSALSFIKSSLDNNEIVFIYCSLGESRSPSIALMYLLENELIEKKNVITEFKSRYYNDYLPKRGNLEYIQNRWL